MVSVAAWRAREQQVAGAAGVSRRPEVPHPEVPHPGASHPGVSHPDARHPDAPRLSLLGEFSLTAGGREVAVPLHGQRIVALLALRGRCVRSRVVGVLWPEVEDVRARACLRTAIWRLNRLVPRMVVVTEDAVGLHPDVTVDVREVVREAHHLVSGAGARPPGEVTGIDVFLGLQVEHRDLLPEWEDTWLVEDRERLRQLRLHALEALAEVLARRGEYGMATEAALAAVRADPLRESAHRALIGVHLAEGNVVEARRAYGECRATLRRELGLGPSARTTSLLQGLLPVLALPGR